MLLLTTTGDKIQVVTDAAVTVDCHASYVDRSAGADTPGRKNTAISTATTTDVVLAPAASTVRNVRRLVVRNRHSTAAVTVTVQHTDGATVAQLEQRTLGPGSSVMFSDSGGWFPVPSGGVVAQRPWYGVVAAALADGDPAWLMNNCQSAGVISATPTNISTTVARCSAFRLPFDLTVNRIRAYGVGATTSVYRVALYRYSDLARLTAELPFTTAANTWVSIGSALGVSLAKDVTYFVAVAVNAIGTTAGVLCSSTTVAATTGQIQSAPGALPGSLALSANALSSYHFQFAVTAGALPATAATLAAQAAWTGGMPAFWLDSVNT